MPTRARTWSSVDFVALQRVMEGKRQCCWSSAADNESFKSTLPSERSRMPCKDAHAQMTSPQTVHLRPPTVQHLTPPDSHICAGSRALCTRAAWTHSSRVLLAVPCCVPPLPTGCGISSATDEKPEVVRSRPALELSPLSPTHTPLTGGCARTQARFSRCTSSQPTILGSMLASRRAARDGVRLLGRGGGCEDQKCSKIADARSARSALRCEFPFFLRCLVA